MKTVYEMVRDVAPTNSTVLLNGETGVGKGVMARLIHRHSGRKNGPFVHVHCGAISDSLVESELFGHEKGAFTGAIRTKVGKFEQAHQGTIFLDEVSTLTPSSQIKLLQVMQDSIFQRVGGEADIHVSVRIIAASNEDLDELTRSGKFRRDLYYRMNVFPLHIPPLRERIDDLPYIVDTLLLRLSKTHNKKINSVNSETLKVLKSYSWPGNIRELENLVERAFILEKSGTLTKESFPKEILVRAQETNSSNSIIDVTLAEARNRKVEQFEREYLKELLTKNNGQIGKTAEQAGISVRQLNNLMNKCKIVKEEFRVKKS